MILDFSISPNGYWPPPPLKPNQRLKLFRKTITSHCRSLNGTVHCVSSSIFSSLRKHLACMHFRVRRFCYGPVPLYCGAEVLDCCQQAKGNFSCWNSGILKRPFQYSNSHMTLINIDAGWLCPLLAKNTWNLDHMLATCDIGFLENEKKTGSLGFHLASVRSFWKQGHFRGRRAVLST